MSGKNGINHIYVLLHLTLKVSHIKDLTEALIFFFTCHISLMDCSIMCDKALRIIRSKFNGEENSVNISAADSYFLKGTCVGIFFLHFSLQPQFSPRKNNLIILKRKSNWLQPHGMSSTKTTELLCARVLFWDLGGTGRWVSWPTTPSSWSTPTVLWHHPPFRI